MTFKGFLLILIFISKLYNVLYILCVYVICMQVWGREVCTLMQGYRDQNRHTLSLSSDSLEAGFLYLSLQCSL